MGEEAKRSVEIEPELVIQFIKRKMGREDDKVTVNGGSYSAPEISAYILKEAGYRMPMRNCVKAVF